MFEWIAHNKVYEEAAIYKVAVSFEHGLIPRIKTVPYWLAKLGYFILNSHSIIQGNE